MSTAWQNQTLFNKISGENANESTAIRMKKDWFLWWGRKKKYLLEKSIVNTARILWLDTYFRPAYFIGIIRNGFAVCEGIRRRTLESPRLDRKNFPNGYSMELCAKQWRRSIECQEKAANSVKNYYLIKYEKLVSNPQTVLKQLMNW